jgi:hypothetical protein
MAWSGMARTSMAGQFNAGKEATMGRKKKPESEANRLVMVGVKLDTKTLARVDSFAEAMRVESPGARMTRSDALRTLILKALGF